MKKNLFLTVLSFGSLGFVSCTSDDDSNGGSTTPQLELFASSNTSGTITYTDLLASMPTARAFTTGSVDADGIYFDDDRDEVIIASRTNNRLEVYGNFRNTLLTPVTALTMTASSTTGDFTNAREIAVDGSRVVVVQDQAEINGNVNKLFVYQRTSTGFTLEKTFTIGFKLWGIDIEDGNLYAVVDLTGDIAVFNSVFSKPTGALSPDKRVTIEGLTRTHGITYSDDDNTMILTDVGLATSATDGGIVVIENFNSVFSSTASGGTISLSNQKRIYGPNSLLGNPVDVSYDDETNKIYVAERLNGGGQVLSFAYPTTAQADATPLTARLEPGVTGIYLRRD
ncbi:hypothetical protein D3C87_327450 [compost metagenome]